MFNFYILQKASKYNWTITKTLVDNHILGGFNVDILEDDNHAKKI
jgi:hypothetical protein